MSDARLYRFDDLPADRPMELLERRRFSGEHVTVAQITLLRGCDVPMHEHENEQVSIIQSGRLRFTIGREGSPEHREVVVSAGEILHLPPNVPHGAVAEVDTVVLDLFSPPAVTTGIDKK